MTSLQRYLFVGGPWDGRWVETNGQHFITMTDTSQVETTYPPRSIVSVGSPQYLYTRQDWHPPDGARSVYVYDLLPGQLFDRLLQGYRAEPREDLRQPSNSFRPAFIETLIGPVTWYRSTEEHLREAVIGPLVYGLRHTAGRAPRGTVIVRLSVRYANPIDPTEHSDGEQAIGKDGGDAATRFPMSLLPRE